MFLVVGLGNPGKKYDGNRHNVGFMALDAMARDVSGLAWKEKFSGVFGRGDLFGQASMLLKPMTFMNLSGDCVQPAQAFTKAQVGEIVVVHDELDVPFGEVRVKVGGGHAGHNGLRSIIERVGSPEFVRIRVGIGRPPPGFRGDVADYVLQNFDMAERAELPDVLARALDATKQVMTLGAAAAMTAVNAKAPPRNAARKAATAKEPANAAEPSPRPAKA
jgi:PTH1 family peptidyl-tRNA hydrolase